MSARQQTPAQEDRNIHTIKQKAANTIPKSVRIATNSERTDFFVAQTALNPLEVRTKGLRIRRNVVRARFLSLRVCFLLVDFEKIL